MNPIALSECCTLLGIDPKTLRTWLKQANMALMAHPRDARLKCLTPAQLEQVAQKHGRPLPSLRPSPPAEPQAAPIGVPQISTVLTSPSSRLADPSLRDPASPSETDLIQQLTRLETTVATLQHQLTDLALQLLQERTQRYEQRLQALEARMNPEVAASGVLPRPMPIPEQHVAARTERQRSQPKVPKTRAPSRMIPLIEYGGDGTYIIICPTRGELALIPDSVPWFEWLATLSSFRFIGQQGRLSASRPRGRSCWMAYRRIHSRCYTHTLGSSQTLTLARLEQMAGRLQSSIAF